MSQETHFRISKLFVNNTYLGQSDFVNTSLFKVIPDEAADREIDQQRNKKMKMLSSDMNAMEFVGQSYRNFSEEHAIDEKDFNFF